jgi:IS4 transposase
VEETIAKRNDAPLGEALADSDYSLVQDRAYGKIGRLDHYVLQGQSFVIRLKDNLHLMKPRKLQRTTEGETKIVHDITCYIGQGKCQSAKRHRVVEFENDRGEVVRVVTDLRKESPGVIAEIYKARWQIEVFFRWIKQPTFAQLTFWEFMQYWRIFNLPLEWQVQFSLLRSNSDFYNFFIP